MLSFLLIPLVFATAPAGRDGLLCSAPWRPAGNAANSPTGYARALLAEADVVIRVRALRELAGRSTGPVERLGPSSRVEFEVVGVLKGEGIRRRVDFPGYLVDNDDFNPGRVPYTSGRSDSRDGSCFAEGYKRGSEYLLLLKFRGGDLTPYWAAVGPTGEQLRGEADPWLNWVRTHLRHSAGEPVAAPDNAP
jgi:hypothetical protein